MTPRTSYRKSKHGEKRGMSSKLCTRISDLCAEANQVLRIPIIEHPVRARRSRYTKADLQYSSAQMPSGDEVRLALEAPIPQTSVDLCPLRAEDISTSSKVRQNLVKLSRSSVSWPLGQRRRRLCML